MAKGAHTVVFMLCQPSRVAQWRYQWGDEGQWHRGTVVLELSSETVARWEVQLITSVAIAYICTRIHQDSTTIKLK